MSKREEHTKKTMHLEYGEPNDELGKHLVCEKCGYCINCGDCKCKNQSQEKLSKDNPAHLDSLSREDYFNDNLEEDLSK